MMRYDRATAFAHDDRVRNGLRIANVHDVPDDVVSVFLQGIVSRAVKIAAGTVVIDSQSSADIEIAELVTEFGELGVIARSLTHRSLDRGDVGHLRADMEMH